MSRRIAPTAALATALMVAVLISSCDSEDSPEVAPPSPARAAELPPGFDVTFRWTVNDNFDPLSAEGTFVRAYVASFYLANEGQSTKWAYPGFVSASPTDIEQRVREIPSESAEGGLAGTSVFVVASREQMGSQTRIVLCEFGYASSNNSGGTGVWTTYPKSAVPSVISFTRPGQAPPARQRGAAREAQKDVFGGWRAEEFEFVAVGREFSSELEQCQAHPVPEGIPLEEELRGMGPTPRPPEPPSPGWPANGL